MSKYDPEYQKEWYQKNKASQKAKAKANNLLYRQRNREYIIKAKSVPCADCDIQYPPYVMQFDHITPDKSFNLSAAASKRYTIEKIQTEIDKCEVVCSNCHAIRTHNRNRGIVG